MIAGSYTNAFTRALLARLGYTVVELEPEATIAEVEGNLRRVASAIGRVERGEQLVARHAGGIARGSRRAALRARPPPSSCGPAGSPSAITRSRKIS